jgi:hypothetical protein
MGACADLVFRLAYARYDDARNRGQPDVSFDTFTGKDENWNVVAATEMRRQALFSVVQARAGKCGVP